MYFVDLSFEWEPKNVYSTIELNFRNEFRYHFILPRTDMTQVTSRVLDSIILYPVCFYYVLVITFNDIFILDSSWKNTWHIPTDNIVYLSDYAIVHCIHYLHISPFPNIAMPYVIIALFSRCKKCFVLPDTLVLPLNVFKRYHFPVPVQKLH